MTGIKANQKPTSKGGGRAVLGARHRAPAASRESFPELHFHRATRCVSGIEGQHQRVSRLSVLFGRWWTRHRLIDGHEVSCRHESLNLYCRQIAHELASPKWVGSSSVLCLRRMAAIGPKWTCRSPHKMSAFGEERTLSFMSTRPPDIVRRQSDTLTAYDIGVQAR